MTFKSGTQVSNSSMMQHNASVIHHANVNTPFMLELVSRVLDIVIFARLTFLMLTFGLLDFKTIFPREGLRRILLRINVYFSIQANVLCLC